MMRVIALSLLLTGAPVVAQTASEPSTATAVAPDADRLAAAKAVMDSMLPPPARETMLVGMVQPMMANIQQAMSQSPQLEELFRKEPRARAVFQRFADREMQQSVASLRASLPALMDAITAAYARRFTVKQLSDVRAFYESDTGRVFMAEVPKLMSDPAIAAVQKEMMASAMSRLPAAVKDLQTELAALGALERK